MSDTPTTAPLSDANKLMRRITAALNEPGDAIQLNKTSARLLLQVVSVADDVIRGQTAREAEAVSLRAERDELKELYESVKLDFLNTLQAERARADALTAALEEARAETARLLRAWQGSKTGQLTARIRQLESVLAQVASRLRDILASP